MTSGRPPSGPQIVDGMEGSPGAKARLRVILETITGTKTIAQACMSLGIGEAAFHKLRSRFLQEALRGLEPRPVGRRPKESPEEKERVQALMDEINALRKDLTAALVREEIAVALPQLVKKKTEKEILKNVQWTTGKGRWIDTRRCT